MQNKVSGLSILFRWNALKTTYSKTFPRSRSRHASCIHGDYVYVIGGKDGHVSLKDVWRFHIENSEWEKLSIQGDKLPFLEGHTIVSHKRLLLLFGGAFGDDLTDSSLWILNPDLKHVRKLHCDMGSPQPSTRRQHSAVLHNNVMYIHGGYIDLKGSSSELWAFHIEEEEWELILQHQKSEETPGGRHGHSAVIYGRDIWTFGGACDLNPKSDLWYFNLHSRKWYRLKTRFGPPCLIGHTAQVVKDNMVVFGGERDKTLTNDFWVFNFGSLRWSHIQLSGVTPPPRMWHSLVALTSTNFPKGESSVRTSSLPYLQNKGTLHRQRRPKSSPAYSSDRSRSRHRREESHGERKRENNTKAFKYGQLETISSSESSSSVHDTVADNVNGCHSNKIKSVPKRPSQLDIGTVRTRNDTNELPVVMTMPTVKVKEEKSPLLTNRQVSTNSVDSASSLQGTDNPCLSLSNDVINVVQESSFSSEPKDFMKKEGRYLKRGQRSRSKSTNDSDDMIPLDTIPKNVIQVKPYTTSPRSKVFKSGKEDIVIEDLEFCENYFESNMSNKSVRKLSARDMATVLRDQRNSSNGQRGIELSDKVNDQNLSGNLNEFSSAKSQSLSDLHSMQTREMADIRNGPVSWRDDNEIGVKIRCWESPVSDTPTTTQSASELSTLSGSGPLSINNSVIDSPCMNLSPSSISSNPKPSVIQTNNAQSNSRESLFLAKPYTKDVMPNKPCTEPKPQHITPYLLLFGGKEGKGGSLRIEPISVWKCDILSRHSDISHGEFHKSSLII